VIVVEYVHELPYSHDASGRQYPRLTVRISNPGAPEQAIDIDAYLDSGAERSLFDGRMGVAIGLDLMAGSELSFDGTSGGHVTARLHNVQLSHPILGTVVIELAFSTGHLVRNLIGRDFFALCQIGFRESRGQLLITAVP